MQTTANYGFKKPDGVETVNIDDLNYNVDIADIQLKKVNDNAGVLTTLKTTAKSNLVAAINEVFQSGTNVKSDAISAVNSKGGSLGTNATWDQIISSVNAIAKGQGNAVEWQVLNGADFSNSDGIKRTGNMPNRGAITITPNGNDQAIPAGYHNGSGIVKGATIESLGGKRWVSGSTSNYSTGKNSYCGLVTITGLNFKPSMAILAYDTTSFYDAVHCFTIVDINRSILQMAEAWTNSTIWKDNPNMLNIRVGNGNTQSATTDIFADRGGVISPNSIIIPSTFCGETSYNGIYRYLLFE